MADPVSIAAGVTGLLAFSGKIISLCYGYGHTVALAPKEMDKLRQEIMNISGILLGLQAFIEAERKTQGSHASKKGASILRAPSIGRSIQACQQTLSEIVDKIGLSDPSSE